MRGGNRAQSGAHRRAAPEFTDAGDGAQSAHRIRQRGEDRQARAQDRQDAQGSGARAQARHRRAVRTMGAAGEDDRPETLTGPKGFGRPSRGEGMNPSLDFSNLPEKLNLAEVFLYRQLPARADAPAVYFGDKTVTYRALADEVDRATAVFRRLGLELEQRVLLVLPDIPEFASAWLATLKAGGVVAAINPDQKADELAYYLSYTRAKIAVAHASALPALEAALSKSPHRPHVLVVGGAPGRHLSFEQEVSAAQPDPVFAPTHRDDPAVWLFTSGSTGFPKAAVHKQHDFIYNALTYGLPVIGYRESDIGISVPKLAFGYALGTNLLFPLLAGGSAVIFPEKATPERMFELIGRHRPTILTAVPTAINAMASAPGISRVDFSSLRVCISAGEALPAELYHRWKKATGIEILDGIGSAEMFHIFIT